MFFAIADIRLTDTRNFLSYLSNIPGDLYDFYSDFGFHVRRGFQTLQRNLRLQGLFRCVVWIRLFSGCDNYVSEPIPATYPRCCPATRRMRRLTTRVRPTASTTAGSSTPTARGTPTPSRTRTETRLATSPSPRHHSQNTISQCRKVTGD